MNTEPNPRALSRWVRDDDKWVPVCGPFFEFNYDEERFTAAIVAGRDAYERAAADGTPDA